MVGAKESGGSELTLGHIHCWGIEVHRKTCKG
jgi:hypothetical protein